MSDETLEARLKRMIVDRLFLQIPPSEIEDDKKLVQDYGVDSVSLFELVVVLDRFGLKKRVNAERALDPRTAKGKGYNSSRPLHRARCCRNEAIAIGGS